MKKFCKVSILIGIILMIACAQAEEKPEAFRMNTGSIVTFGRYEQDGNSDNGGEKIEWIVLDVQQGKCLLLSRYCLDTKPYHSGSKKITWKDSSLRKWLNSDFLNSAFLPMEQEIISVTAVDNSRKQGYSEWKKTKGGKNTKDRVFLLSCAEADRYLGVSFGGGINLSACCEPTAYAAGKGAHCESLRESDHPDTVYAWWWLRSPGYVQNAAAGVDGTGTLLDSSASWEEACVRPAIWVSLDELAGIFLEEIPFSEKKTCGDYIYTILENGTAEIVRYSGRDGTVSIPETLDGYPVTVIGNAAFDSCSYVTSVTIPDGVTAVDDYAFIYCRGMTSVTLPDSLEVIGADAFTGCSGLASVSLPDGLRIIGRDAFFGCSGLTSVAIPDSVEEIGNSAFSDCSGLVSMTIPKSVKALGEFVFNACTELSSVTFSEGCTDIPDFTFSDCKRLTSVTIPQSVKTIGARAFWNCSALTYVVIPEGVESIGMEAFGLCESLVSVTIPDSITFLGASPFTSSGALKEIRIAPDHPCLELVDNVLFSKPDRRLICFLPTFSQSSYSVPDGILEIGERAFWDCDTFENVTIPDGVISIGEEAFYGCSVLCSVRIPASVTAISENALGGCGDGMTVMVERGSFADQYCKKHKLKRSYQAKPGS